MSRMLPLLLLAAVLPGCSRGGIDEGEEDAGATAVDVDTATAVRKPFPVTLRALGKVVARAGHAAAIAAPAASRVMRIDVAPGDRVRAGEPLIQLDATVWRAELTQAEAEMVAARKAAERADRLTADGILPRKEADQARAQLAQAEAALAAARRTVSLALLRSPIDGVVVRVSTSLSAPVDASEPLLEIIDPDALEAVFHVSPADARLIAPGDTVTVVDAADEETVLDRGTVASVGARVDSVNGSVEVRARLVRPARLRVGETIAGTIRVATNAGAVVVPAAALVPREDDTVVYIVDADGIAHERQVTAGARTSDEIEILTGLEAGEVVVTRGAYGLEDGARVVPRAAQ